MNNEKVKPTKFQFHNGSIKSRAQTALQGLCQGFNSTMVRLKDFTAVSLFVIEGRFNSTMVRLKGIVCLISKIRIGSFNSTMVRLKVSKCHVILAITHRFQFHNGSIKSHNSIPTAKTGKQFNSTMVRLKVRNTLIRCGRSIVSIPQWFD